MAYVLQFPTFTEYDYVSSMCDRNGHIRENQVFTWLTYGKISESPLVVPSYSQINVEPSSIRRYLSDVTVNGILPSTYSVTLAAAATLVINNESIGTATSSNTAYATAAVADGVLTITGVASGTATITIKDTNNNLIGTVTVTVS